MVREQPDGKRLLGPLLFVPSREMFESPSPLASIRAISQDGPLEVETSRELVRRLVPIYGPVAVETADE